jgi:phosphoribosylanthranilate isomerase
MSWVKICGVTRASDATESVRLGVRAIGVNFVASSPRCVDIDRARAISRAVHEAGRGLASPPLVVGVVADMTAEAMRALAADAELDCLQLHGDESEATLAALLPHAYKAVRIATADDVTRARAFGGDHILVDAKVDGALGGTGVTFDWELVRAFARERKVTLAGGLEPGNVARAIREVHPFCVDTASGVESAPGIKDLDKVRAFVEAARRA